MSDWLNFVQMGLEHIWSWGAYDHILFLFTICATFRPDAWRALLILVTAFTLGHGLTILLAGLWGSALSSTLTEWLVAFSIVVGAVYALAFSTTWHQKHRWPNFIMALLFGLVHGLAFSGLFRSLNFNEGDIWGMLLGFNLGVEAGQLAIIALVFLASWLWVERLRLPYAYWRIGLSTVALLGGTYLVVERWLW